MITDRGIPIEFESPNPKFETFKTDNLAFAFSSAGSALTPGTIKRRINSNLEDDSSMNDVVSTVKNSYLYLKKKKFAEEFLEPRGLSFDDFYERGLHNEGRGKEWDRAYSDFSLNLDITLTGVDDSGEWTYRVSDGDEFAGLTESFGELGFDAVGTGASLARDTLTSRYSTDLSELQGLYILYTALQNASQAPGVGRNYDIAVISDKEVQILTESEKGKLNQAHFDAENGRNTPFEDGEYLEGL